MFPNWSFPFTLSKRSPRAALQIKHAKGREKKMYFVVHVQSNYVPTFSLLQLHPLPPQVRQKKSGGKGRPLCFHSMESADMFPYFLSSVGSWVFTCTWVGVFFHSFLACTMRFTRCCNQWSLQRHLLLQGWCEIRRPPFFGLFWGKSFKRRPLAGKARF